MPRLFRPAAAVDVVTAIYLLNYARTSEQVKRFSHACFRALRPGGVLVGFNDNVRNPPGPDDRSLAKYGLERTCARHPPREGDAITVPHHQPRRSGLRVRQLLSERPDAYEAAMHDAGFGDFRWIDAMLDPAEHADPFWHDFMAHAPLTAFYATRA